MGFTTEKMYGTVPSADYIVNIYYFMRTRVELTGSNRGRSRTPSFRPLARTDLN